MAPSSVPAGGLRSPTVENSTGGVPLMMSLQGATLAPPP
jgi:hypothetical protein